MNNPVNYVDRRGLEVESPEPRPKETPSCVTSGGTTSGDDDFFHRGWLRVEGSCDEGCYVQEGLVEDPNGRKVAKWNPIPKTGSINVEADAVGTPRGIVKIPGRCTCTLNCNDLYKMKCDCEGGSIWREIAGIPRVLPPGSEFPDPRKEFPFVGRDAKEHPYKVKRSWWNLTEWFSRFYVN
jgi:hypothetical protein